MGERDDQNIPNSRVTSNKNLSLLVSGITRGSLFCVRVWLSVGESDRVKTKIKIRSDQRRKTVSEIQKVDIDRTLIFYLFIDCFSNKRSESFDGGNDLVQFDSFISESSNQFVKASEERFFAICILFIKILF